ncbi:hypothetical protein [Aquimarina algicola]|uniref:Uncharacterized protein n=1 Tax=Aquimarina algicola TaxID=2589995 RepID=A0A504J9E3_9FLAO|nr:hypothetical protein [Aquimarina algicola]TPN85132.1 hypothetical protein FHK87_13960 [Aquimarina algicola]
MMKHYILYTIVLLLTTFQSYSFIEVNKVQNTFSDHIQDSKERKLTTDEVRERGLDLLANEITENLDGIDLRKSARSAIFETPYGFRWKMVNLHTGKTMIIKVDKDFNLISARNSAL